MTLIQKIDRVAYPVRRLKNVATEGRRFQTARCGQVFIYRNKLACEDLEPVIRDRARGLTGQVK